MRLEHLNQLRRWFDTFVDDHLTGNVSYDRDIRIKHAHTCRVAENMRLLGRALGLDHNRLMLAEVMALYHDIGRFEQYRCYRTFNDRKSKNHALWGVRIIAQNRLLGALSAAEKHLIYHAVAHHNRARLPVTDHAERLFYMRLLRDADKLDIWHVVVDYYRQRKQSPNATIELGLPDRPTYSQPVLQAVRECRIANMSDMTTLLDFQLLQISWVFDLNFLPAFEILKSKRYLEQLATFLPADDNLTDTVAHVLGYRNEVLSGRIAAAPGLV